jgi:hypothetical protein
MSDSLLDALKSSLDPESFKKLVEVRASMEKRFMRLTDETNVVRILPSSQTGKLWFREVQNHFKVGGMDKKGVCSCNVAENPPSECFVCDSINFLKLSSSPQDQEYGKAMRPSRIYWVNAYNPKADIPVVKILPLSYTTFQQLFQLYLSGEDVFLNTESGVNVIINKQPGNKYFVRLDRTLSPISSPELLDQRHDLEAVAQEQRKSYQEQSAFFPPEFVARMKAAGFVKGGDAAPAASPASGEVLQPAKNPTDVKESMEKLMAAVSKTDVSNLEDI